MKYKKDSTRNFSERDSRCCQIVNFVRPQCFIVLTVKLHVSILRKETENM